MRIRELRRSSTTRLIMRVLSGYFLGALLGLALVSAANWLGWL